ncbi:MAG TPA: hypothetical protein P5556_10220 [Candidatus Gastranaerophilales bacterium]|nr:hypothetical protein [Candidatus Gastranaerophilales bacterium]
MEKVASLFERNKNFEEAHCTCKELLDDKINKIETYVTKWLVISMSALFLFMSFGFAYFYFEAIKIRKRIDYRYFLIEESLEDIHNVKIENGKVIRNY